MSSTELEIPADPEARKALKGYVDELVVCYEAKYKQDQQMSDILTAMNEDLELPKAKVKALARTRFKSDLAEKIKAVEDLEGAYEILYGETSTV